VASYFGENTTRAAIWFKTPNPVLNNLRPCDYYFDDSWKRLEKMIDDALEESDDGF
jgi:hypothetical protein